MSNDDTLELTVTLTRELVYTATVEGEITATLTIDSQVELDAPLGKDA